MLVKNQVYETVITDYTSEGQGVAHIEGCAVFIPNAIAGEKVTVRIEKAQKTWAAGKIVEILEKSPHRCNRECPVAKLCGGCDFWHMDYEEETRLKAERVRNCLNRLGGETLEAMSILAAPTCYGYRNKAQYPVSQKKGKAYAGFFRAGTHDVVENKRCLILPDETDAVKDAVMDYVNQYRITVYDEVAHKGLLRHIYVRRGVVSGQVLVCLVCNGDKLPRAEELLKRLQKIPGFTTLVLSVNTKKGNAVLGDKFITLHGPGYIEDTLCGLTFRLSPRSFYQVNHHQAQRLYQAAIEQAEITKEDLVLDLYCGVGTITLAMASAAGKVIGVEVIPQAVEDAKDNAKRNGIENAEFFCGDAGQAALELEKNGVIPDVVVVDPPRKGLNADTIEALHRMAPRRIVYVSCDPATLARDVALLKERGYTLKNAQACDLFPRCSHVESVVTLIRADYIAVFDSGLGGISVLRHLRRRMPGERYLYFGDSANAPYGSRTTGEVRELTLAAAEKLMAEKPLKALVLACNTATAAAVRDLREKYPELIVIGIEPALKVAADHYPGGRIGVMATEVTLREEKFDTLLSRFHENCSVAKIPMPGLVQLVEAGKSGTPEMDALLRDLLTPYIGRLDAVVLGCTHYPLAAKDISKVLGESVVLLDGGDGTARETRRRLQDAGLLEGGAGELVMKNSKEDPELIRRAYVLLEEKE